ncbi:hypothetical protein ACSRUE_18095 [Sorangium sp. KYC3313]|uniref:hypothetical protein n=1 Tax=Sorangium sp. KYC3313 TaxID=3449740 RepID=UPI003F8C8888
MVTPKEYSHDAMIDGSTLDTPLNKRLVPTALGAAAHPRDELLRLDNAAFRVAPEDERIVHLTAAESRSLGGFQVLRGGRDRARTT